MKSEKDEGGRILEILLRGSTRIMPPGRVSGAQGHKGGILYKRKSNKYSTVIYPQKEEFNIGLKSFVFLASVFTKELFGGSYK